SVTSNRDPILSLAPIIGVLLGSSSVYLAAGVLGVQCLNTVWNVIAFEDAEARFVEASGTSKL
ncbi:hypothetical protein DFP72DRAFT_754831, partial [Ephemerocybe angulata]